jgi:hypothetical protein
MEKIPQPPELSENIIPNNEINKTNPMEKPGEGLDFWAEQLLNAKLITRNEYADFIKSNNSKEAEMKNRSLPQLEHYGKYNSVDEIKERIHPKKDDLFIIRCLLKGTSQVKRLVNASFDQAIQFAKNLPGEFDKYEVEMKEFVETKIAGTIIVNPSGKTMIETWHGPHYLNTTNVPKYHANFDPEQFDRTYKWTVPEDEQDLDEMKKYAMKVVSYIFPHLKPKPNEPIYLEYGVKPSGEIYFIEASDSPLLTGK